MKAGQGPARSRSEWGPELAALVVAVAVVEVVAVVLVQMAAVVVIVVVIVAGSPGQTRVHSGW